jgi:D-alanyl-D-alanine dipeptidase
MKSIKDGNYMPTLNELVRAADGYLDRGYEINPQTDKEKLVKFGDCFVREAVAEKLERVNWRLSKIDPELKLTLKEGYRSLDIQKKLWQETKAQFGLSDAETHKLIAFPQVAGHPTGAAVDVILADRDMAADWKDFTNPNIIYRAKNISPEARFNRRVLRCCMMTENFTPFNGEYWHFSYGDIEWAVYMNKFGKNDNKEYLYGQTNIR